MTSEFLVRSAVMPDGSYGVSIEVGQDRAFALDRATAVAYTEACHREATVADHCASVLRLLTEKVGIPEPMAIEVVQHLLDESVSARRPFRCGWSPASVARSIRGRTRADSFR